MERRKATAQLVDRPAKPAGSVAAQFATRPEVTRGARPAHRGNTGSWVAVTMIIVGFVLGACALPTHWTVLWILTGVALVVGGVLALVSKIMEQAH